MRLRTAPPQAAIAMIIVMVVIIVLSVLAAGFAYSMKVETKLARNVSSEADILWLARSGVELARYVLAEQKRIPSEAAFDALNQKWAGGFGTTNSTIEFITLTNNVLGPGTFSVRIEDLERRININLATPEMLQRALELMGYDTLVAATVTDSIGDWLDRDSVPRMNGAESDDYLSLPKPYVAKNGIMDDLSELLLIRGVTSEMFWGAGRTNLLRRLTPQFGPRSSDVSSAMAGSLGLVDFFSIGGLRTVNLNTASREVLQILPGMDENLADGIVRMRAGLDGVEGTEDDTPLHNVGELVNVAGVLPQMAASLRQVCGVTSTFFEVRVQVWVERYERTYVALLYRNLRPGGRATENSVSVLTAGWD